MKRVLFILLGALLLLMVSACDPTSDYYKVAVTVDGVTTEYTTCLGVRQGDGGRYIRLIDENAPIDHHCSYTSRTTVHLPQNASATSTPLYR